LNSASAAPGTAIHVLSAAVEASEASRFMDGVPAGAHVRPAPDANRQAGCAKGSS
jgi:hypothetical protein